MARTIDYRPLSQTDFSNVNALLRSGADTLDRAFKTGQDTLIATNKAIEDRNTALVNQFINNISIDDLNKPETQYAISNFIKDIDNNTGATVNHTAINDALDKRYGTLQSRKLLDQEFDLATDKYNKTKEESVAETLTKGLIANGITDFKGVKDSPDFNTLTPIEQYGIMSRLNKHNSGELERLATDSTYKNTFDENSYKRVEPLFKNTYQTIEKANTIINNPLATSEQKEQASKVRDDAQKYLQTLTGSLPTNISARGMYEANKEIAIQRAKEQEALQKQQQQAIENHLKERQVATGEANAETNAARLAQDIATSKNNPKPQTELEKQAFTSGYTPDVVSKSKFQPQVVANKFKGNIDNFTQNELARLNTQSFTQYLGTKEAQIDSKHYGNTSGGFYIGTKQKDLINYLVGANLKDHEKIAVYKAFVQGNLKFNELASIGDSTKSVVNAYVSKYQKELTDSLEASKRQYAKQHIGMLRNLTGMSEADLLYNMVIDRSGSKYKRTNLNSDYIKYFDIEAQNMVTDRLKSDTEQLKKKK